MPDVGARYTGEISKGLIPNERGCVIRKDLYASLEMDMGAVVSVDSVWIDLGDSY